MILISVILLLLIAFLVWILWTPVTLMIDSDHGRYELVQNGIFKTTFHPGESPRFRISIMGFRIAAKGQTSSDTTPVKEGPSRWKLKRSHQAWMILLRGVYRSLAVRSLVITADIDDVVLNAQLIPVILMMNRGPVRIMTNFEKRYFIYVVVQLRLNMLLWPVVRFFTKK